MKELWTKDQSEYHGVYYDFPPVYHYPKPVQKPHPPVLLGSKAPNVFKRTVAYGDGWIPIGVNVEDVRHGREELDRLAAAAEEAGLDGMIVPDLPPEEAESFERTCAGRGIYLIPLLAPTSTDERIERACGQARGFIYCVSLTGVTGARQSLSGGVGGLVERIRRHTDLPVLVGFGVSKRQHVEEIGRYADGAVVASAMLDAVDRAPDDRKIETAAAFVRGLKGSA